MAKKKKQLRAYKFTPEFIERLAVLAKSLGISNTKAVEWCVEYCLDDYSFVGYALDRKDGLEPEIGNALTDWLSKGGR